MYSLLSLFLCVFEKVSVLPYLMAEPSTFLSKQITKLLISNIHLEWWLYVKGHILVWVEYQQIGQTTWLKILCLPALKIWFSERRFLPFQSKIHTDLCSMVNVELQHNYHSSVTGSEVHFSPEMLSLKCLATFSLGKILWLMREQLKGSGWGPRRSFFMVEEKLVVIYQPLV